MKILRELAREWREIADELAVDGVVAWNAIEAVKYYERKMRLSGESSMPRAC